MCVGSEKKDKLTTYEHLFVYSPSFKCLNIKLYITDPSKEGSSSIYNFIKNRFST